MLWFFDLDDDSEDVSVDLTEYGEDVWLGPVVLTFGLLCPPMLLLVAWHCRHSRNASVNLRARACFNVCVESLQQTILKLSSLNDMMKIVMCFFLFTPFILLMVVSNNVKFVHLIL